MSVKKFVLKHVFNEIRNVKSGESICGKEEGHFGIIWKLRYSVNKGLTYQYTENKEFVPVSNTFIQLELRRANDIGNEWTIDFEIDLNLYELAPKPLKIGIPVFSWIPQPAEKETQTLISSTKKFAIFGITGKNYDLNRINNNGLKIRVYPMADSLNVEVHITIKKIDFERPKTRIFYDGWAKRHSDVCLLVGNQKFYKDKEFLAAHSTYFKSLFFGNFSESGKSEIELKDIDPEDFQRFLEVLYGDSVIDDYNVEGILKLADMYNTKTPIGKCEKYLLEKSKSSLKIKFTLAVRYNLDALKEKCLSELKTTAEIRKLVPENAHDFGPDVWKELLLKATTPQ